MAFPILPLLAAGGLTAGTNYFRGNEEESSGFLDSVLGIDRTAARQREREDALIGNLVKGIPEDERVPGNAAFDTLLSYSANRSDSTLNSYLNMKAQAEVKARERQQALADKQIEYERADLTELAGQYRASSTKFAEQQAAFQSLRGALEGGSPQDAMVAVMRLMKAEDPTSAITQSETGAIEGAEGEWVAIQNQINKLFGQGWGPKTRKAWFETARSGFAPKRQKQQRVIQSITNEANRRGVPVEALFQLGIDRTFPSQNPFVDRQTGGQNPNPKLDPNDPSLKEVR